MSVLGKLSVFSMVFFIPKLKPCEWKVHFLHCFVIFICTIFKKNYSVYIHLLSSLNMWLMLSFQACPILIFSILLLLINSIDSSVQFALAVQKDNSLSFLDVLVSKDIYQFSTTVFRQSISVSLTPHVPSNHPPQLKMAAIYIQVYRAINIVSDHSNLSNELNYIQSLPFFRGYNTSIIDKALNKCSKPVHQYQSTCFTFLFFDLFQNLHNPFRLWFQSLF